MKELRRSLGLWDVVFFNVAAVLENARVKHERFKEKYFGD